MILRIKATDFSNFSGYAYEETNNDELNKYINLYKSNKDIKYFQIESVYNGLDIHQISYICDKLDDICKVFFKTEFDINGNGKTAKYILCFAKKEIEGERE